MEYCAYSSYVNKKWIFITEDYSLLPYYLACLYHLNLSPLLPDVLLNLKRRWQSLGNWTEFPNFVSQMPKYLKQTEYL